MILARSPYYIVTKQFTWTNKTAEVELRIWRGDKVNDEPTDPIRTFTLQKPALSITKLSKDIAPHIRDFFLNQSIDVFNTTIQQQDSQVWVKWNIDYIEDASMTSDEGIDYAVEGYSSFLDGVNHQKIGILQNNIELRSIKKVYDQGITIIGFNYDEDITVETTNDQGTVITSTFLPLTTASIKQIQYVVLNNDDYGSRIQITVKDSNLNRLYSFDYQVICENKFEPKNIIFKNKYGAFENIYFFKKSTESLKVENEEFIGNVITPNATYNTAQHQFKNFNTNTKMTLNLTSGFVDEELNQNLKELMHSNAIWLQENNRLIPLNIKTTSKEFKSERVDQKISYDFEFEYAFNELNTM